MVANSSTSTEDPFETDRQVLVWLANEETHTDGHWQIGDFNICILLMTHKDADSRLIHIASRIVPNFIRE